MATISRITSRNGSVSFRVRYERPASPGEKRQRGSKTFRVPTGASERAELATEKKAARFARSVEAAGGIEPDDLRRLTVAEVAQRFLEARARRVEPSTLTNYRKVSDRHVLPVFGAKQIGRVTALEIEGWLSARQKRRASAATVSQWWTILRMLFKQAVRWEVIAKSPCAGVDSPRTARGRERSLSRSEETALVEAMRGDPLEALWRVLLYGGLRIGEAVVLRWCDIQGDRILVRRTAVRGSTVREGTKTGQVRDVIVDRETAAAFARLKAERGKVFPASPCFPGGRREWLATGVARKRFSALCRRAGLPADVTPHVLRHTHVTALRKAGVAYPVIGHRVGHRSLATTAGYDHVDDEDDRAAVVALEAFARRRNGASDGNRMGTEEAALGEAGTAPKK